MKEGIENFLLINSLHAINRNQWITKFAGETGRTENIDVTAVTNGLARKIQDWKLEDWAIGDHRAIMFAMAGKRTQWQRQRTTLTQDMEGR